MATARLRLYRPADEKPVEEHRPPCMSIPLSDLYPLLAQAFRENYTWLRDFENEDVVVSGDLYEVIRAFANIRPSA